jgi:hypothetical protein
MGTVENICCHNIKIFILAHIKSSNKIENARIFYYKEGPYPYIPGMKVMVIETPRENISPIQHKNTGYYPKGLSQNLCNYYVWRCPIHKPHRVLITSCNWVLSI